MATNSWQLGALYPSGGLNDIEWQQPGGVGTQVFPAQAMGVDYFSTVPFNEFSGLQFSGCGHSLNTPLIQREYDYNEQSSVALICCPLCGYVNNAIYPFEAALDTVYQPMVIA